MRCRRCWGNLSGYLKIDSNGLWSDSITNLLPHTYWWNRLHPNRTAYSSFSICVNSALSLQAISMCMQWTFHFSKEPRPNPFQTHQPAARSASLGSEHPRTSPGSFVVVSFLLWPLFYSLYFCGIWFNHVSICVQSN